MNSLYKFLKINKVHKILRKIYKLNFQQNKDKRYNLKFHFFPAKLLLFDQLMTKQTIAGQLAPSL